MTDEQRLSQAEERDLLQDTFCIYCQREFVSHDNLVRHIERKHPDTYAYNSYVKKKQ